VSPAATEADVLRAGDLPAGTLEPLLGAYGLSLAWEPPGVRIPGSYWADEEAGLVGASLHLRPDTPVHSVLHEACHFICMDEGRRRRLHTDAGGDALEESAVCYLQVLLAERLPGVGARRLMADMDAWGYSFRLGSTRAWLEHDAEDARAWLLEQGLIDPAGHPTGRLRP
jgi:hypothetical protein